MLINIKYTFLNLLIIHTCILGSVIMSVISCKKLVKCDAPPTPHFVAKIVNQQGENLVFGNAALYNPDSIKILKQTNPSVMNGFVMKNTRDSTLDFEIFIQPLNKRYIYYNSQTPLDSLEIKWLIRKTRYCGNIYEVDSVKFNNGNFKQAMGIITFVK
ncbi:MAG: hypothetical protein WKF85_10335 [Chitinophagaceae bacterium]